MADMNVIVCGGGPAGLVVALSLQKNGFKNVVVLEKRSKDRYFQDVGGGYDLGPATGMIMDELEVNEYYERTFSVPELSFHDLDGSRFRSVVLPENLGIRSSRRSSLQHALLNKLGEEFIHFGCGVSAVNHVENENGKGRMEVTVQEGQRMRCDLVIGAEGLNSQVRSYVLGEEMEKKIHDCDAMLYWGTIPNEDMAKYLSDGTIKPTATMAPASWVMGPNTNAALYLLGNGENVWVLMLYEGQEEREARKEKDATDKAEFNQQERSDEERREWWVERVKQAAIQSSQGIDMEALQKVIALTPAQRIARTPLQDLDPFETWHKNQAVLIGDAAHAVTPFIGQGANMAMADSHVLGLVLKKHLSHLESVSSSPSSSSSSSSSSSPSSSLSFEEALTNGFVEYENLRIKDTNSNLLESRTWGDWMVSPSRLKAFLMKGAMWLAPTSMIANQYLDYDNVNKDALEKARGEK